MTFLPEKPIEPVEAVHEWSSDGLLTKAQRMFEEMLRHGHEDWRCALWSALALELLGRAALARISPTLLAADSKGGADNLIYALGLSPRSAKFVPRSIDVSTVFDRLHALSPEFTRDLADFSILHMQRRNEELHSGNSSFDGLGPSSWLPKYYRACTVLVESLGQELEFLVGKNEADAAAAMIAASLDESAKSVGKAIHDHKTKWGAKPQAEQQVLVDQAKVWANRYDGHRVICPSCGSVALVTGEPIAPPIKTMEEDYVVATQKHLPSKFECIACGLKISGLPQLAASGLGDTYTTTSAYEVADYYRTPYDEYEDDNNEY